MEAVIAIVAILATFGIPALIIKRWMELRHERLLAEKGGGQGKEQLEAMKDERKLLLGRIENLETIVCSVDHELNLKLNRLLIESNVGATPALPAPTEAAAPKAPTTADVVGTAGTLADPDALARKARPATDSNNEIEVGSLLDGRYLIGRLLGRGGMGAVYMADDQALGEPVALKVVSSTLALDPAAAAERFRREAQAARRISHKNVIRIHDLGEAGALLYISMEYFPGKTLAGFLDHRGTLSEEEYTDILGQICDGLEAAHGAGVVHRDLKPGNVLIGERSAVKIIDFGLATSELRSGLTVTGQILGTPNYMSPEQVRGRPVDARSDIYSLGALAYHAVTGAPPFAGASPIAIGFAHLMEEPTPVRDVRDDVSAALATVIGKSLAKEPADRPQSVSAFRKALG